MRTGGMPPTCEHCSPCELQWRISCFLIASAPCVSSSIPLQCRSSYLTFLHFVPTAQYFQYTLLVALANLASDDALSPPVKLLVPWCFDVTVVAFLPSRKDLQRCEVGGLFARYCRYPHGGRALQGPPTPRCPRHPRPQQSGSSSPRTS